MVLQPPTHPQLALLQQDLRFRFVVTVALDIPSPPYAGHARADGNGSADVASADSSADDAAAAVADGRRRRNDGHADGRDAAVAAAADGADAADNDADGEPSLDSEWVFLAADGADASAYGDVDVDACEDVAVAVGHVDASACADVATYVVDVSAVADVAVDVAGVTVGLWASHCLLLALWACRALCVLLVEWAWLLPRLLLRLLFLFLLLVLVLWQVIRVHPARIVMMVSV